MMDPLKILDRQVAFAPCLVDVVGGVASALLLSQAIYWQNRCESEDGWWCKSAKEWQDEIRLKQDHLETCRKKCQQIGVLEYKVSGLPPTGWYRVDRERLAAALELSGVDCALGSNSGGNRISNSGGNREATRVGTESPNKEQTKRLKGSAKQGKAREHEALLVPVPKALDSPPFREVWNNWLADRRARHKQVTALAAKEQLEFLAGLGVAQAIKSIRQSIACGYQGLFEPKSERNGHRNDSSSKEPDAEEVYSRMFLGATRE